MGSEWRQPRGTARHKIAALVVAHQAGDRTALSSLVNELQPMLTREARRILRDGAEAEDAFIVAIERVIHRLDTFEDPTCFLAYARRAVKNAAVDIVRSRQQRDSMRALKDTRTLESSRPPGAGPFLEGILGKDPGPENNVGTARRSSRIRQAVDRLKEPRRTAVALYYFQGWTLDEIGVRLGLSTPGAKRLLGSARVILGSRLHSLEADR
jgi:RNA polymerase sigma-70 factor (ECF subfamily)